MKKVLVTKFCSKLLFFVYIMKTPILNFWLFLIALTAACQSPKKSVDINSSNPATENTLLWKISGNGLEKASYLFGTIHLMCSEDALLSDSLIQAIKNTDEVYLEVDMDNLFEMMSALSKMKMKNDTTLADLLSEDDYETVRAYFEEKGGLLPFTVIEKYKPFLAASTMLEGSLPCEQNVAMEQLIMEQATTNRKKINGLETMNYQMSLFDSIPYKVQAELLVKYIKSGDDDDELKQYDELVRAYKSQDLNKLEELTRRSDMGIANFEEVLLYNRNRNWVKKLNTLLKEGSFTIAVGAGHLPGENGVISLLRKAGFTVTPVKNEVVKKVVI